MVQRESSRSGRVATPCAERPVVLTYSGRGAQNYGAAASGVLDQPAHGEYYKHPEPDAQHEDTKEEAASGEWLRVAKWTIVSAVVLVEIAWLIAGAYLLHGLVRW